MVENQFMELLESCGIVALVGVIAGAAAVAVSKLDKLTFRKQRGPMFMRGEIRCYLNRSSFGRRRHG